uniref:hypothetical protein n=1 Tax=Enterocloster aldenensis TaxID=358742 RepID=UPI0011C0EED4
MGYPVSAGRGIRPFGKVHGVGPGRYMGSVREGISGRSGKVHPGSQEGASNRSGKVHLAGPGRYIRAARKGHPIGPGRGPSWKFGQ